MSMPAWQPRWIGAPGRALYAGMHPAPDAGVGVVLAPPLLHEQPRSRRVLLEIARRLAGCGVTVLRFDYFGTGDSDGRGGQHDFAAMAADFDAVVAALHEDTGIARVGVLAWGAAALPAAAWAARRDDIAALALWEPVADGASWLAALEAADRAERAARYAPAQAQPDPGELMGYPVSPRWRADFAQARLAAPVAVPLWTIARAGAALAPSAARRFELPADAPRFDGGVAIERTVFLSRALFGLVEQLGRAFAALEAEHADA